jgi:hypothetical protein
VGEPGPLPLVIFLHPSETSAYPVPLTGLLPRPKNEDRSVAFQFTISVDDVDAVAKLGEAEGGKIKVLR